MSNEESCSIPMTLVNRSKKDTHNYFVDYIINDLKSALFEAQIIEYPNEREKEALINAINRALLHARNQLLT